MDNLILPKKIGRPTKYKEEYCDELIKFFDIEPYTDIDIPHFGKTGEIKWMDLKRMANRLPTVRNFCKQIGIDYGVFYDWLKRHPKFNHAFIQAKDIQKWFLIENGLNGMYNPAFAIFVATNITDMRIKSQTDVTGTVEVVFHESLKQEEPLKALPKPTLPN